MAKCPTCGREVSKPVEEWHEGRVHAKIFECCGVRFRESEIACGFCALIRHLEGRNSIILYDERKRPIVKTS
jgi:hypothetical protein